MHRSTCTWILDPETLQSLPPNAQDVGRKGHWGTGDVELLLTSQADLDAAEPWILMTCGGRAVPTAEL